MFCPRVRHCHTVSYGYISRGYIGISDDRADFIYYYFEITTVPILKNECTSAKIGLQTNLYGRG